MIRVELPAHLRTIAGASGEVSLAVEEPMTLARVLDALEARFPMLKGTIRDQTTKVRRPFLRFFACEEDLSHQAMTVELPAAVKTGAEVLIILGAVAGG